MQLHPLEQATLTTMLISYEKVYPKLLKEGPVKELIRCKLTMEMIRAEINARKQDPKSEGETISPRSP